MIDNKDAPASLSDQTALRDWLYLEYLDVYKDAKQMSSELETSSPRVSARRTSKDALDAIAKLAGIADITGTDHQTVTYHLTGISDKGKVE